MWDGRKFDGDVEYIYTIEIDKVIYGTNVTDRQTFGNRDQNYKISEVIWIITESGIV